MLHMDGYCSDEPFDVSKLFQQRSEENTPIVHGNFALNCGGAHRQPQNTYVRNLR